MSFTTIIPLAIIGIFFLSWWYNPNREGRKIPRLVEEHCPKELIEILMTFRTADNKWSPKFTADTRDRLREDFGPDQFEHAEQAVEFGKTEIFIREEGKEDQFLYAHFDGAILLSATFIPAVSSGKMGL